MTDDVRRVIEVLGLEPLAAEGGLFRQTWQSPVRGDDNHPLGTSILAALTDEPDSFSAMHRLPNTEIWHAAYGHPIQMLLLFADGSSAEPILGRNVLAGQQLQIVVPGGTWMGASLVEGGTFGVFGCTMAPGFIESDYEGSDGESLSARWPQHQARIESLVRQGGPLRIDHPLKTIFD